MNALILNVDDHAPALYAKSRILRQASFDVLEAGSGAEALKHVRTAKPQLVLLDVNLPDMSGLEVCRSIKSDPETAQTIVLQISATAAERADRVRGLEGGADGYLTEPVEATELIAVIRAYLRLHAAEQALRESEARYRTLIESLSDGAYAAQQDRFVFANEALSTMLGYTAEEFGSASFGTVIGPESLATWTEQLRECLTGTRDLLTMHEVHLRRKGSAEPLWAEVRGRPVLYNGRIVVLGIIRDITERKRMEQALHERTEALIQQDRNKDEFLAMLAHELRNPLAPLTNALAILESKRAAPADVEALHAMMRRQVAQLARLVNDLVDASRITSGKIKVQRVPIDLREVLQHAVETSRPLIDARRHQLSIVLADESLIVNGDSTRLTQVFLNLLNNAAKYTDEQGRIDLTVRHEDGKAVVSVQDNGRGISASLIPHIFDLFIQADRTLTRSQDGLGIGLTLVRRLVHEHGGEVHAHSDGIGRGSTFTVRLPLATREETTQAAAGRVETGTPRLRIVLLDDNRDTVTSYAALLEELGHEVLALTDPREVFEIVHAFRPHVALLDINMPGLDGFSVAARLHERFSSAAPRLIALTGYSDAQSKQRIEAGGFSAALVKPISMAALQDALRAVCS